MLRLRRRIILDFSSDAEQKEYVQAEIDFMEQLKSEMVFGIQNHDQYYDFNVNHSLDTNTAKCVRIADSLSFMSSDVSDLMKADSEIAPSQKIISDEKIQKLQQHLEKLTDGEKLQIDYVINMLKKDGFKGIRTIQKECINAIKVNPEKEQLFAITDRYKAIREVDYHIRTEGIDSPRTVNALLTYQNAEGAKSFLNTNETRFLDGMRYRKSLSPETKEKVTGIMGNIKEDLGKELSTERSNLRKENPVLASIYEIQDKLQYEDILYENKTQQFGNLEEFYLPGMKEMLDVYYKEYESFTPEQKIEMNNRIPQYITPDSLPKDNPNISKCPAVNYAIYHVQQFGNNEIDQIAIDKSISNKKDISTKEIETSAKEAREYLKNPQKGDAYVKNVESIRQCIKQIDADSKTIPPVFKKAYTDEMKNITGNKYTELTQADQKFIKLGMAVGKNTQSYQNLIHMLEKQPNLRGTLSQLDLKDALYCTMAWKLGKENGLVAKNHPFMAGVSKVKNLSLIKEEKTKVLQHDKKATLDLATR